VSLRARREARDGRRAACCAGELTTAYPQRRARLRSTRRRLSDRGVQRKPAEVAWDTFVYRTGDCTIPTTFD